MNNPENQLIDIEEMREWLKDHKQTTGLSWTDLGKRVGIASGTISQFGGAKGYAGDERKLAEATYRYRQSLTIQSQLSVEAPTVPGYFETPTSRQITSLYSWALRGRMVAIATGPGVGKTMTARNYRDAVSNVFVATLSPSSAGVNTMQQAVLRSMGERDAKGTPLALSQRIIDRLRDSGGLLIIDEAQHASEKAIEEIRSWYDAINVGIVLQGNMQTIARLEGGSRSAAFAQLYSRVSMRMVRPLPAPGDATALCEAWEIHDEACVRFIETVSQKPGGLRSCTMVIELGMMFSRGDARGLSLGDLQDAWAQLATRPVLS